MKKSHSISRYVLPEESVSSFQRSHHIQALVSQWVQSQPFVSDGSSLICFLATKYISDLKTSKEETGRCLWAKWIPQYPSQEWLNPCNIYPSCHVLIFHNILYMRSFTSSCLSDDLIVQTTSILVSLVSYLHETSIQVHLNQILTPVEIGHLWTRSGSIFWSYRWIIWIQESHWFNWKAILENYRSSLCSQNATNISYSRTIEAYWTQRSWWNRNVSFFQVSRSTTKNTSPRVDISWRPHWS